MFSASLRSTLVALVASAVAVSAVPGLQLALSGADKVDGLNNLKIIATVTNTGDETLKVLNDPRGPLSQMPTETFAISHDSGAVPAFTGVRVGTFKTTFQKHNLIVSRRSSTFHLLLPRSAKKTHSPFLPPVNQSTSNTIVSILPHEVYFSVLILYI